MSKLVEEFSGEENLKISAEFKRLKGFFLHLLEILS